MAPRSVRDLVPGAPEEIWLLADSYGQMARHCEEVNRSFRAIDDGGWRGPARDAFHARFEQQPGRLLAMADSYSHTAVALDTYAAVLAWAQRQAQEVIAWDAKEEPRPGPSRPTTPALTVGQQAELAGVITGSDGPEPKSNRVDQRALALSTYHRALAMLDTVGNESAATIRAAAELMPAPVPALPTGRSAPLPNPGDVISTSATGLVVHAVLPAPKPLFDPTTLRDDPQSWAAAINGMRKRLRWDGLNRISLRLDQHIFEGHYRPSRAMYTGYHHRENGVDHGELRVVEVIDGPDPHGVYAAQVRGPRCLPNQTKKSTFFPDSWSRAEVRYAVRHAFLDAMQHKDTHYDPVKRQFRGVYRGVRIVGHLRHGSAEPRLHDIVTAYPRGVRHRRRRS